jgi:hypothetical protein
MTGLDNDRELEDFLARRSPFHRRLADRDLHEPTEQLDRVVLSRAREAIEAPRNLPIYRSSRAALPLALAATVVLAISVTMSVQHMRHGEPLVLSFPSQPGSAGINAPSAAPEARDRIDDRVLTANASPAAPAVLAPQAELDAKSAAAAITDNRPARTAMLAKSTARMLRMQTEVHDAPHTRAEPDSAAEKKSEVDAESLWASTAPASSSETAASAGAVPSATGTLDEVIVTNPAEAPPAARAANHPNREAWLQEIQSLRNAGKVAEAEREMAAFQKAFPNSVSPTPAAPPPPAGPAR